MIPSEDIDRLIRAMEGNSLTAGEFASQLMGHLWGLPLAQRHAALEELSAHPNEDVRNAAVELQGFMRHEQLSKNLDYIRQNSPLRPGVRLELFGGYDYYSSEGKPWWLNGRDCYRATFLRFACYAEGAIPYGLVEFDEPVELEGHKGRYGILRASFGSHSFAWGEREDTVEVHVVQALPEEPAGIPPRLVSDSAAETHATYRIEEAA